MLSIVASMLPTQGFNSFNHRELASRRRLQMVARNDAVNDWRIEFNYAVWLEWQAHPKLDFSDRLERG
jgi:hypothetical protein